MDHASKITTYLFAHKASVQSSTIDQIVKDVKLSVFYGMSPIPDDEIRTIVVRWATINAVGLLLSPQTVNPASPTAPGASPPASESEFIEAVKKAVSRVSAGVTLGKKGGNINIGVTGVTANLGKDENATSLRISWVGTLKLDANSGPFHFSGALSKDSWSITLSFPQESYIPDMSSLGNVFSNGVTAVEKMAVATRNLDDITDVRQIGALIKPNATAVQNAVEAINGIAKAKRTGGASFGFKVGSPPPTPGTDGTPPGVEGSVVFTYVF